MRTLNPDTEIKFGNTILDIEIMLQKGKVKYIDMEDICRKHGASYSLPTFLTRLGYIGKVENNYYVKLKEFDKNIVKNIIKFQSINQKALRQKRARKINAFKDEDLITFKDDKYKIVEGIGRVGIERILDSLTDERLVSELRKRGYEVICKKIVEL